MQIQAINNNNTNFRGTLKTNDLLKKVETYVADKKYCDPSDRQMFNKALDYIKNKTPKTDVFELHTKNKFYDIGDDTAVLYRNGKPVSEWWIDRTDYGDDLAQEEKGCIMVLNAFLAGFEMEEMKGKN